MTTSQKVHLPSFVIPAPYQVRDELQQESINFRLLWPPASAGVTRFLTFHEINLTHA